MCFLTVVGRCQVPGSREVPGSSCTGGMFQVPGARSMVLSVRYQVLGVRYKELKVRCKVPGIRWQVLGDMCQVPCTRCQARAKKGRHRDTLPF